jgi:aconitate hydratase
VKAVVAKSFERIHAANLINFGILPLTFVDATDYEKLNAGDKVTIPQVRRNWRRALRWCC